MEDDNLDMAVGEEGMKLLAAFIEELIRCLNAYKAFTVAAANKAGRKATNSPQVEIYLSTMKTFNSLGITAEGVTFEDHAYTFLSLYEKYKDKILDINGGDFMRSNNDFTIVFGEGDSVLMAKNGRIILGGIYDKACIMRGDMSKSKDKENSLDYLMVPTIKYYLYSLMATSIKFIPHNCNKDDLSELYTIIDQLRYDAHLDVEQVESETKSGVAHMAGGMIKMAARFMKGEDGKALGREDTEKMATFVTELFDDKETLDKMTSAASAGTGNYGESIVGVFGALKPRIMGFATANRPAAPPGIDNSKNVAREERGIHKMFDRLESGISIMSETLKLSDSSEEESD